MSTRVLHVHNMVAALQDGVRAIQREQDLVAEFPAEVEAEAALAARNPRLPDLDRTDLPFVTIDPVGARDLDQAMYLARDDDGYVVYYAIADVAAFVTPGGAVDLEARRRGESMYGADSKIPLHPKVLSEDAASLLPDQVRPALLWTIRLDAQGSQTAATLERALVRSTAQLDYDGVQDHLDAGTGGPVLELLAEIGRLRQHQEAERGGVSLPMPDQVIDCSSEAWTVEFRELVEVEDWNAQISLLTGFAAASMMVYGRVGILRTLPPPEPGAVTRLHRTARALGIDWPPEQSYPDFIRSLDPNKPQDLAMVTACTSLLRGAGYTDFNGDLPGQPLHAALASEYAHVTAPLRRLVDRFGLEVCVALSAGTAVPQWVLDALGDLPGSMRESGRRANAYEGAIVNLIEASTLQTRVGEVFRGTVVETEKDDPTSGDLVIRDPAVTALVRSSSAPLPLGEEIAVTLTEADPATRRVQFSTVG